MGRGTAAFQADGFRKSWARARRRRPGQRPLIPAPAPQETAAATGRGEGGRPVAGGQWWSLTELMKPTPGTRDPEVGPGGGGGEVTGPGGQRQPRRISAMGRSGGASALITVAELMSDWKGRFGQGASRSCRRLSFQDTQLIDGVDQSCGRSSRHEREVVAR